MKNNTLIKLIPDSILYDSSRRAVDNGVRFLEDNPEHFKTMFDLCAEQYPLSMRAARVIQLFCIKYPEFIKLYLPLFSDELLKNEIDGVKRSLLKILIEKVDIKHIYNAGLIFNQCLDWLFSEKETIAVRAYSLDLAVKFVVEEPDLKSELMFVLENLPTDDYPSLEVRRRRCIQKLKIKKIT